MRIASIMIAAAALSASPATAQTTAAAAPSQAETTAVAMAPDDALSCATTFYIGTAIKPTPDYVRSMEDRVSFMMGIYGSRHAGIDRTELITRELAAQRTMTEMDAEFPAKSYAWCNEWIQAMGRAVVAKGGSTDDEKAAQIVADGVKPARNVQVTSGQSQIMTAAYTAWRIAGYPTPVGR